jgi:hypothetical protein
VTVETSASSSVSTDDAGLLAEIPPAMLAKLKADSRQRAISTSFVWTVFGAFVIPNLAKQWDASAALAPLSNQLGNWVGILLLLSMIVFMICGAVAMLRGFLGQPALLRTELRYRRQHGKWRWER